MLLVYSLLMSPAAWPNGDSAQGTIALGKGARLLLLMPLAMNESHRFGFVACGFPAATLPPTRRGSEEHSDRHLLRSRAAEHLLSIC
jgi:hypothetical protein